MPAARRLQHAIDEHRAGRLERAAALYDEVLREHPGLATAHAMRGVLAHQRSQHDDALASLDRALAIDPAVAGVHLNRGNVLRALGRLDDAAAAYEHALELDDGFALVHNNLGNVLCDRGRFQEAADAYRRALESDPELFAAASNLAHTLEKVEAVPVDELLAAQRHALALASRLGLRGANVANCHNAVGRLLQARGDLEEAINAYAQAIAIDPMFDEAHANSARALTQATRLEEAIAPWRRAIELRPDELDRYGAFALTLRRLGRDAEALEVYRAWLARDPADPTAAHMIRALGGGEPPERASDEYVRAEFDGFSANFDRSLARLEYRAPELVVAALGRVRGDAAPTGDVLDAGCGTGLCGPLLRSSARTLVGVDLSEGMLARARERGLYDQLVAAELTAYLDANPATYDVVVAADVLIYFGALETIVRGLRRTLRAGGALALSVECGDDETRGYTLLPAGRYAHHPDYLRRTLTSHGFVVRELEQARLRYELGVEVLGWVVAAIL